MLTTLDFLAVIFASAAVIDVWHKGSIFETARVYAQALQDVTPPETLKGRLLELLNCPYCKSYHVPVYLCLGLVLTQWINVYAADIVRAVVYGLAATRIGNLINDLLPNRLRYLPDPYEG